jgi:DNA-binding XRE family transcriptional regulator
LNLREYRESIPMQVWEFARHVDADDKTIRNAEAGDRISAAIAREIARVLSEELGRQVRWQDIDDLHVRV